MQVPPGYRFNVLAAWGEPVGIPGNMPVYRADASNTAEEQAAQMGMHSDGLLPWTPEKVKKSQNPHGLPAYEARLTDKGWQMVRSSRYARRFTLDTEFTLGGPATGHSLIQTAADSYGNELAP